MTDKEFIEMVYKKGRVKDLANAFERYPVEDEWHEGKAEKILNEVKEKYSIYEVGDIVFVNKYKYKNSNEGYKHLFVIISQNNLAIPMEYFAMLVSSKIEKAKYNTNILLKKDEKKGLNKDNIIKLDNIYKIENENILFKIGKVDLDKVEEYKRLYLSYFGE